MKQLRIDTGLITGIVMGEKGNEVNVYRGIPYASPPVGDLRWKAPSPPAAWKGVRKCTEFSRMAPQNPMFAMMYGGASIVSSDDCLYLNVMVPANRGAKNLPVMVWFHGGMYALGSANDLLVNNHRLPQQGVVLVTVNHRLDIVGLMVHPLLSKESENGVSGNYMFLDMIASLKWVQRNIGAFGGDPGNVTIFGESGGGAKVSTLMASPLAKDLFHRVICESGTATATTWWNGRPLADLEAMGQKIFEKAGVTTLEEARALPYEKFYAANAEVARETGSQWGIVDCAVDDWFLKEMPLAAFRAGKINAVPFICVANQGELQSLFPMLVPGYVEMLKGLEKAGVSGYACIFNRVPNTWHAEGLADAPHGMELLYVFGDYDNITGWWDTTFRVAGMMGGASLKMKDPGLNETDKYISEAMMKMWAQFAATGKPGVKGLVSWPVYNTTDDRYLYVDKTLEIKAGFSLVGQKK
ncbi:MAG: carboxylesterase family protein [Dehalococcoidales bacterium]|jgi:para-nitrobenzyl esterase